MLVKFNTLWNGYPAGYSMQIPEGAQLAKLLEDKTVSPVDVREKPKAVKPEVAPAPAASPAPAAAPAVSADSPAARPKRRRG